jgi:hypothetical protein
VEVSRSLAKEGDVTYGNLTKLKAIKNKMSPPYRLSSFEIVYGQGIDKFKEIMDLGNEFNILRKYGKTITYAETKYPIDEFETLLSDNPEFLESITNDIVAKIKQTDLPEEVEEVERSVIDLTTLNAPIIQPGTGGPIVTYAHTTGESTTIYEQLKQQALANNNLL